MRSFSRWRKSRCCNAPADASRTLFRAMIPRRKTARRIARRRRISARRPGRIGRHSCRGRRFGDGSEICATELALVRHRRLQDSAMGGLRWACDAGPRIRAIKRRNLCDARSQTAAFALGGSFRKTYVPTREQSRLELEKIATFAGMAAQAEPIEFERDFYPRLMRALFASNSWLVIVMITDLLARKERFNTPGMATSSNWTRRMRQDHVTASEEPEREAQNATR